SIAHRRAAQPPADGAGQSLGRPVSRRQIRPRDHRRVVRRRPQSTAKQNRIENGRGFRRLIQESSRRPGRLPRRPLELQRVPAAAVGFCENIKPTNSCESWKNKSDSTCQARQRSVMNHTSECTGFRQTAISRRHLLQVGGVGLLGLGLPGLLQAAERTKKNKSRAKAVIFLHQFGGPSHVDTFDMKPSAPEVLRGEFKPVATKAPGLMVCERLPGMARVADKFTLIRSMHHSMKNHNPATYYSL